MDAQLIDLACAGDEAALEELLRAVRPLVQRRCARLLPFPQDAEEACQDALLAIATKLETFAGTGSFEGWVSVIATNQARVTYRRLKRYSEEFVSNDLIGPVDPARTSVIAGSRVDLFEAIDALERTHPETLDAFVLRDLAGLPYAEIAERVQAPLGTVKARIHTARRFLRRELRSDDNLCHATGI